MKIPCSLGLLTLNSAKYLERCLCSVVDFEDVFLLDGNSTDDTFKIAQKYGRSVYKQVETEEKNVKIKNFTEVRLKAFKIMRCDWVLQIDSDEFVTKELVEEIKEVVTKYNGGQRAFNIQKKYVIGDKKIEHAFNYPNYYLRLFNKKSGITLKGNKIVHEQMFIPPNMEVVNLRNCVYSELSPTYKDCVKKDGFQLGLMRQTTFAPGSFKNRLHSLKISALYFLRSGKIIFKSLLIYLRYGYKESLPFGNVLRHVRVHLYMSYWRLLQVLF